VVVQPLALPSSKSSKKSWAAEAGTVAGEDQPDRGREDQGGDAGHGDAASAVSVSRWSS
jgi:hypothetical protein